MTIRRSLATDREVLLDIWLRSVRATHTFLTEADIQALHPLVRDYLAARLAVGSKSHTGARRHREDKD